MNLLMFSLAVDAKHVTLAFGLRWIEALALRFEHIDVVTMTSGDHHLPENVRVWSVGRERGYPEWLRVLRFYWLVGRIMHERRIDIVFTHMIPVFAVMYWPVAAFTAKRNVLWYAHGSTSTMLKVAHNLVDRVVTSTPDGFRLPSSKVCFVGQGVDTEIYVYRPRKPGPVFRILSVGRLAPSKGLDLMITALTDWHPEIAWQLILVGDATSDSEREYAGRLRHQAVAALGSERITLTGRLDAEAIADLMATADVFVNLGSTGSLDKAIVEAMASGCPVLSSNDAFRTIANSSGFPECAIEYGSKALREALAQLNEIGPLRRQALADLQANVARRDHALVGLIDRLYDILADTARRLPT